MVYNYTKDRDNYNIDENNDHHAEQKCKMIVRMIMITMINPREAKSQETAGLGGCVSLKVLTDCPSAIVSMLDSNFGDQNAVHKE